MLRKVFLISVYYIVFFTAAMLADEIPAETANEAMDIERPKDPFPPDGIEVIIGVTNIYQQNTRGGLSTHRRAGRYSGSYDLEVNTDLEKLFDITGGQIYIHAEGYWSKAQGINAPSVGSAFGVNDNAERRQTIALTEMWYEQEYGEKFAFRAGKMDLTGSFICRGCRLAFDGNAYANSEYTQFLNAALVNNPTVPFPDYGLAVVLNFDPTDWFYVAGGAADAKADFRETGFNTTFDGDDEFFYVAEAGITPRFSTDCCPLTGAYRAGLWIDSKDKQKFSNGKNQRNDVGFYAGCDQLIFKENEDPEDTQGLGIFARYGLADSDLNNIANFWSLGLQYQGLFDTRSDDVLAFGMAQGIFSDRLGANDGNGFTDDRETAYEMYYSLLINENLTLSPSVQYISNPGGDRTVSDAVIVGARAQFMF